MKSTSRGGDIRPLRRVAPPLLVALCSVGLLAMAAASPAATHSATSAASADTGQNPHTTATVTSGASGSVYAYVTNTLASTVTVTDAATDQVITTIPVATDPRDVVAAPNGSAVYVVADTTLDVISTATNTVTAVISLPDIGAQAAITADGSRLYIAGHYTDLMVVDTKTDQVSDWPLTGLPNVPHASYRGAAVAVSPDGKRAYVTTVTGFVSVFNTATGADIKTFQEADYQGGILTSHDGADLYVVDSPSSGFSSVQVLDATTGAVKATIPVSPSPEGLALSTDGKTLYVTDQYADVLSQVDLTTDRYVGQYLTLAPAYTVTVYDGVVYLPNFTSSTDYVTLYGEGSSTDYLTGGSDEYAIALVTLAG